MKLLISENIINTISAYYFNFINNFNDYGRGNKINDSGLSVMATLFGFLPPLNNETGYFILIYKKYLSTNYKIFNDNE